MARSKAYLQRGVQIRWKAPAVAHHRRHAREAILHFPNGLADFLGELTKSKRAVVNEPFAGRTEKDGPHGRVEWAITWVSDGFGEADGFLRSYCNTVYTPDGGFHEAGFRAAIAQGAARLRGAAQQQEGFASSRRKT